LKRRTCARDLESETAAGIGALLEWRKNLEQREQDLSSRDGARQKKRKTNDREPVQGDLSTHFERKNLTEKTNPICATTRLKPDLEK
jgi:hypothetical protein